MHKGAGAAHGNTREQPHMEESGKLARTRKRRAKGPYRCKSCLLHSGAGQSRHTKQGVHPGATPGWSWHRLPHIG